MKSLIRKLIKTRVKEKSIKYCSAGKYKRSNDNKHLVKTINALHAKIQLNHQNEEYLIEKRIIKENLDALYRDKVLGAQVVRSKVRLIEEGGQSTSYFLGLEKHRHSNNMINKLKKDNITCSDDAEILEISKDFIASCL